MSPADSFTILLGSKSPRRKWIFEQAGFDFKIVDAEVDETFPAESSAHDVAVFLAEKKAAAYTNLNETEILITADTLVSINDRILNKPADEKDAFDMLEQLSGQKHFVYTGVSIKTLLNQISFYEPSEVFFKKLTAEEILFYIAQYKPFDKAGAYGIQDWMGLRAIEKVNGCFYNVMGFPMARFCRELEAIQLTKIKTG